MKKQRKTGTPRKKHHRSKKHAKPVSRPMNQRSAATPGATIPTDETADWGDEPGNMIAAVLPGCVVRGGKDVEIDDVVKLRAEHQKGRPVMPPRFYGACSNDDDHLCAPARVMEDLLREGRLPLFLHGFFLFPSEDGLGNAHEVSSALMCDLIRVGKAAGWVWVEADVWGEKHGFMDHSWLEYCGWAVDASCGRVWMYPARWYRKAHKVRKIKTRDAAATLKWMQKTTGGKPIDVEAFTEPTMAKVFDFGTWEITEIPTSELAPGMQLGRVPDCDGPVWVDTTMLGHGTVYRSGPFDADTRKIIASIADRLSEVHPQSMEEWVDGFRASIAPAKDVFVHDCIAAAYAQFTTGTNMSLAQKREIYMAIVHATSSTREAFPTTVRVNAISMQEALAAADLYRRTFNERDGVAKCTQWNAERDRRIAELQSETPAA